MRKFAHKEDRTKNVSKTEVHSIPLWILSGYTRELADIKLRYSIEAPNKYLYCTVLFCTVVYKN